MLCSKSEIQNQTIKIVWRNCLILRLEKHDSQLHNTTKKLDNSSILNTNFQKSFAPTLIYI